MQYFRQYWQCISGYLKHRQGLVLLFVLMFAAPAIHSQNIFFNRIGSPPGKDFLHITGMVQDKQGYMWFASKNGLFRYDGYTMKQYRNDPLNQNSLGTDALESICIDKDGIIWIGTFNGGLERLDPAKEYFTRFRNDPNDPSSLSNDTTNVVFCDKKGDVWVGTYYGLNKLDRKTGRFKHYRSSSTDKKSISSDVVRAIYEDRNGDLWIGTGSVYGIDKDRPDEGGLNKMDRATGTFTRYKHDPNDPNSLVNNKVRAIFEDSKGHFWVGTAGDGLHSLNRATGKFERHTYDPRQPQKLSRPPLKKAPYYDHITFITEDVTGAIWIGTAESGLNYYDPVRKQIKHYEDQKDSAGNYTDYTAWAAYNSREGVLWISTLHGMLYRINPARASVPFYSTPSRGTTSVYTDDKGHLWIGTDQSGMIEKDSSGKVVRVYKNDPLNRNGISSNGISCIMGDREGGLWVGTYGSGLNKLEKATGNFITYRYDSSERKSHSRDLILGIYPDPDSSDILWIGTFRGLDRLNKRTRKFRHYLFYPNDEVEFGPNAVTSILKDSRSDWWASSWERGGLHQFDPVTGKSKTYLRGANVIKVHEDHSKNIWAVCREGLFRLDRKEQAFIRFNDLGFLSDANDITNLVEDDKGYFWLTTLTGIVRVNPARNESTLFGKSYGINGNDFYFLASAKNKQGKLFFGAQSGYYSFFPDEITQKKRAPEIAITGFKISNKPVYPGDGGPLASPLSATKEIRLRHDQDVFSFEFVGIDYSNPEENRHLFMLENYDAGWNLAGSERSAIYFNVPPGKYVFRIKVVNSFGVWAEKSIDVIVTPPWWSTWWFRIGAVLLVAGIFYAVIRGRIRQKFNRQLEQSEKDKQLAELRQKTGELEMQALRAQMNPHFVFNSLNAINRFILENNKTQASEYLTKFSRLVRMILQNSQSALITLESELESLRLYLELEALRFDHRFAYRIAVPKDLDIDIMKVPPLIIQPYAENAIWHGLMHKDEKGNLEIDIRQQDDQLVISIKDDGIGRKRSAATTSKTATKHKSMGLKITADRIAMLQRSAGNASPVVIIDRETPEGTAAGTEVIIKIPVIYD
ncbi:MAG TPA: two-component regulator propeller domain-containing protein [Flavisolibacter sp.]|nr:two-component regulator propeller domain-containing protein [Flavisolibacter sp.]